MTHAWTVTLLCCATITACRHDESVASAPTPPPGEAWLKPAQMSESDIKLEPVVIRDLNMQVVTTGRVTFDDLKVSHVFSPVAGRVMRIDAKLGDKVKKGQALAVLESPDLGQYSADMDKARAAYAAAKRDFERQQALYEGHAAAQRDFETAQDVFLQAKAELERATQKTKLLLARRGGDENESHGDPNDDNVTQDYVLRAPIDGDVVARNINPGMEVQGQYSGASAPLELFTLGDLDTVWVISDIFEMDMSRVRAGGNVLVDVVAYPNEHFAGVVDWVAASVDPNTRTTRVRSRIDNAQRKLKPEMFATVTIAGEAVHEVAVPSRAVFHLAGQAIVFVQVGTTPDGQVRLQRRLVNVTDNALGEYVLVHQGLKPGETVVVHGGILLTELTNPNG